MSEVAGQVAEFFDERGLVPVVNESGVSLTLHAAPRRGDRLVPLCKVKRQVWAGTTTIRPAEGSELLLRQCRQCAREHIQAAKRGVASWRPSRGVVSR